MSLPVDGFFGLSLLASSTNGDSTVFVELQGVNSSESVYRIVVGASEPFVWSHAATQLAVQSSAVSRSLRLRVAQVSGIVAIRRLVLWQVK